MLFAVTQQHGWTNARVSTFGSRARHQLDWHHLSHRSRAVHDEHTLPYLYGAGNDRRIPGQNRAVHLHSNCRTCMVNNAACVVTILESRVTVHWTDLHKFSPLFKGWALCQHLWSTYKFCVLGCRNAKFDSTEAISHHMPGARNHNRVAEISSQQIQKKINNNYHAAIR